MIRAIAVTLLFVAMSYGQSTVKSVSTASGSCGVNAVSGNDNTLSVVCPGISKAQFEQLRKIFVQIAANLNQAPPGEVIKKLDELQKSVDKINRQFGASLPPDMDFQQSQIAPWPDPPLGPGPMAHRERDIEMLVGPHAGNYKAGVSLIVTLKGAFKNPQFWIRCSAPCSVNQTSNDASTETSVTHPDSSDPAVARVQFTVPTQLPAGAKVFMDVRSTDKSKIAILAVGGGEPPN